MIIEILKSAIIGIIQGITEWLPISSTGHMILAEKLLKLNVSAEFWDMFKVVIQLPSILAVVIIYFHKLNPFSPKKTKEEKKGTYILWSKVIVAAIPAAIAGFFLDDLIDGVLSGSLVIALTLFVYGIAFLLIERGNKNAKIDSLETLSYKTAFCIGLFQVLALIPGTSRSGSTILGAILLGCSRFVGTEFSFFMASPIMLGASVLKIAKYIDFLNEGGAISNIEWGVLISGFIVTFFVSYLAIKFLLGYIKKHDFKAFGIYRIILAAVILIAVMAKLLPM